MGTRELLRKRAVVTQEDRPGDGVQGIAILRRKAIFPQNEDIPACLVPVMLRRRLARPDQRLKRGLELLSIGVSLLVQNDEIDRQPLHAPVLVSAQELSDDLSILGFVDSDQDDRDVPGDLLSP